MAAVESEREVSDREVNVHGEGNRLTADEAEQYDRQIRLWGLDAQKR